MIDPSHLPNFRRDSIRTPDPGEGGAYLRLAKPKVMQAILTLEAHMMELQSLRDAARTAGQLSAAITAEVKRGELMRFYVKQV